MSGNIAALVTMEAKTAVDRCGSDDLAERFAAACKVAQGHWMAPSEDDGFLGAVGALYELADEDERTRILAECESIKVMNAMLSGVPVDLDAIEALEDPIGLMKIWRDVRDS